MSDEIGDPLRDLSDELWSALSDVRKEVERARVIASDFEPRDGLQLLDRTVIGLLDAARVQAETFATAVSHGIIEDAGTPPRRYILETVVDLFYLSQETDRHRAAARIAVWELRSHWRILLAGGEVFASQLDEGDGSDDLSQTGSSSVRLVADELDDPEEGDLLLEVFDEQKDRPPDYHWTGKGRFGERIRSLEGRVQRHDPELAEQLRIAFSHDWKVGSAGIHPRPGWRDVVLRILDEGVKDEFSDTSLLTETRIITGTLGMVREAAAKILLESPTAP